MRARITRELITRAGFSIVAGTDHGTVAAAHNWDEPMQAMQVRPSHEAGVPDTYPFGL